LNKSPDHKRILTLTSTFPRWKDDTDPPFVLELCHRLAERFRIHVLAPHAPGSLSAEDIDGIRVTRYRYSVSRWENLAYCGGILANLKQNPLRYGMIPFFILFQLQAIQDLHRRYRFDLIHAHWLIPQGLCAAIFRNWSDSSPPLLCTSHGGDLFGLNGKFMDGMKRWVIKNASAVTTVSSVMGNAVSTLQIDMKKIHVIPMGVDLQKRFVPPHRPRCGKKLLFVGRLVEKKGLTYLIDALPLILAKHPETTLTVIGEGPEKNRLLRRVSEFGIENRVTFKGAIKNASLPGYYQDSDIVVFPSVVASDGDREGFGLVLVEALGCACAAVVTDLPAMRDIVKDGRNALVVRQKDARQIADAVIRLLDHPPLCQRLGEAGRLTVLEKFDWAAIAAQYGNLIDSITVPRQAS
jgi:glycosyltransferase involved in cell wall biosynthesis